MFIIFEGLSAFLQKRTELSKLENEYVAQAKQDIKKDKVTFKYAGGLEQPVFTATFLNKIDSVRRNYGITYFNTGCIIDDAEIEAQQKYENTVNPYLEKRNGKNWEAKMNAEIEKIKKDYR